MIFDEKNEEKPKVTWSAKSSRWFPVITRDHTDCHGGWETIDFFPGINSDRSLSQSHSAWAIWVICWFGGILLCCIDLIELSVRQSFYLPGGDCKIKIKYGRRCGAGYRKRLGVKMSVGNHSTPFPFFVALCPIQVVPRHISWTQGSISPHEGSFLMQSCEPTSEFEFSFKMLRCVSRVGQWEVSWQ